MAFRLTAFASLTTKLCAVCWGNPNVDIVKVQDIGLSRTDDRIILERSAQHNRIMLWTVVEGTSLVMPLSPQLLNGSEKKL